MDLYFTIELQETDHVDVAAAVIQNNGGSTNTTKKFTSKKNGNANKVFKSNKLFYGPIHINVHDPAKGP